MHNEFVMEKYVNRHQISTNEKNLQKVWSKRKH